MNSRSTFASTTWPLPSPPLVWKRTHTGGLGLPYSWSTLPSVRCPHTWSRIITAICTTIHLRSTAGTTTTNAPKQQPLWRYHVPPADSTVSTPLLCPNIQTCLWSSPRAREYHQHHSTPSHDAWTGSKEVQPTGCRWSCSHPAWRWVIPRSTQHRTALSQWSQSTVGEWRTCSLLYTALCSAFSTQRAWMAWWTSPECWGGWYGETDLDYSNSLCCLSAANLSEWEVPYSMWWKTTAAIHGQHVGCGGPSKIVIPSLSSVWPPSSAVQWIGRQPLRSWWTSWPTQSWTTHHSAIILYWWSLPYAAAFSGCDGNCMILLKGWSIHHYDGQPSVGGNPMRTTSRTDPLWLPRPGDLSFQAQTWHSDSWHNQKGGPWSNQCLHLRYWILETWTSALPYPHHFS